nr:TRAM domain-containing protein [Nocardioides marmorisolisilvae]
MAGPAVGDELDLTIGPVAHGGHFVARHEGRVVFVRHALTGERVRARVTEEPAGGGGRFLRADAIEVFEPSPHRVSAPCALARPDGCGGCDFQHVEVAEQRRLKTAVVREQLQRLAGIEADVECEAVPGDDHGLRWRTRMQYVALPGGRRGLRKHRSHDVVEVVDCPIEHPDGRVTVGGRPEDPDDAVETVLGRRFRVAADGFWQVHPGAPRALVETVLEQLAPRPGERVLDLYAGVGLFSAFLAGAVGAAGSVVAVESDRRASAYAAGNLADLPQASVVTDRVDRWLHRGQEPVDLVVLDPPRAGAKRRIVEDIAGLAPRAVAYVACDPAALARDLAYFAASGYGLAALRCLDLFPMTHHVECVALLTSL